MARSNMLFDVLANILKTKSLKLYEEHIKSENFKDAAAFMIRRYLTMHPNPAVRDIVLDNYLTLERMPDVYLYKWLIYAIPQQNTTFIKYLK
jgi:hypothetical protein